MEYFNVHTHVFTMNNAPRRFLHLYMPEFAANLVDKITNTETGEAIMAKVLKYFGEGGKKYASFLTIGKSNDQVEVFTKLAQNYKDSSMKFIALTLNMEYCGADSSVSGFEGQLEQILIAKKRFPEQLYIFLSVDPRWKSNGKELRDAVVRYFDTPLKINETQSVHPFVGLKLYPSTGFYAFDERLKETFEWASEKGVPVLSHCSYLGGIFNNDKNYLMGALKAQNPYNGAVHPAGWINEKSWKHWLIGRNEDVNNKKSCSYFIEPEAYVELLKKFPKLKLCLAHFGGEDHMMLASGGSSSAGRYYGVKGSVHWTAQIQELMTKYPGLYSDISYSLWNRGTHKFILSELANQKYGDRIMFGTDFFMTEREQAENKTYRSFKDAALNTSMGAGNAWDKVAGSNILNFLKSPYYP